MGDVARRPRSGTGETVRVEHWTNAREQAILAAHNLLDPETAEPYAGVPYVWSDQFGERLQLAGTAHAPDIHFLSGGSGEGSYLALRGDGEKVVGAVGFGCDRRRFNQARRLVTAHTSWDEAVGRDG